MDQGASTRHCYNPRNFSKAMLINQQLHLQSSSPEKFYTIHLNKNGLILLHMDILLIAIAHVQHISYISRRNSLPC